MSVVQLILAYRDQVLADAAEALAYESPRRRNYKPVQEGLLVARPGGEL